LPERPKRRGWLLAAAAAGAGAGLAIERYLVGRQRGKPDRESAEPFGNIRGTPIGPVTSFDGTPLHVEEIGSGPTLVLSHGYSLSLESWHYQMRDLASENRLVLYDHRGHGRSGMPPSGDWSIEALARDLDAVLRSSGPEPAVVVGHSMGGMAALKHCEMYPESLGERVAGLVLAATTAADVMSGVLPGVGRRMGAAVQALQEALVPALASLDPRRADRLRKRASDLVWLGARFTNFGPQASPSQISFVERLFQATPMETILGLVPAMSGLDVTHVLDAIDVPALVIVGALDRLTPPGAAERIAWGIKRAQLVSIPSAGHMAMMERPRVFNAHLRSFLSSVR
jgi:pimeloyl-ACP methyl ester carboxylesterase